MLKLKDFKQKVKLTKLEAELSSKEANRIQGGRPPFENETPAFTRDFLGPVSGGTPASSENDGAMIFD